MSDEPNFHNHVAAFAPNLSLNAAMKEVLNDRGPMRAYLNNTIEYGDGDAKENARRALAILEQAP